MGHSVYVRTFHCESDNQKKKNTDTEIIKGKEIYKTKKQNIRHRREEQEISKEEKSRGVINKEGRKSTEIEK
jgi:hypothetical protein